VSKTAIIYYSKYGTTRQYAEWIAEKTGAQLFDARKFKKKDLAAYDTIVYGGGIYAGGIKGIDLITKNWYKGLDEKNVIVFAVGITVGSEACRQQCLEVNFEKRFVTDAVEDQGKESGQFTVTELLKEKMLPIRCFFLPGAFFAGAFCAIMQNGWKGAFSFSFH
jgi:flavodoxin